MNSQVRTYLLEVAKRRNGSVTYSEIVRDCKLGFDLTTDYGKGQLGNVLGEVSSFEHEHQRPLLSALVIYKDQRNGTHGKGFYQLAEQLGLGDAKRLETEQFGVLEMTKCYEYWQNSENYERFAKIGSRQDSLKALFTRLIDSPTYDWAEDWKDNYVDYVNQVASLRSILINNPEFGIDAPEVYKELGVYSSYQDFMYTFLKEKSNPISTRGQSVLSDDDFQRIIHNGAFKFLIKNVILFPTLDSYNMLNRWWFGNEGIRNRPLLINRALAACNPQMLSSTVDGKKFWKAIDIFTQSYKFNYQENDWNWFKANHQLAAWLDIELKPVLHELSDNEMERIVWRNIFVWLVYDEFHSSTQINPNRLELRDPPNSHYDSFPNTKRSYAPVEIDFQAQTKLQKDLGDAGEELVKQYEIDRLIFIGRHSDAERVKIVQDGEGYDVLSFDEHGNEVYIEVKTTTGGALTPFFLSDNEVHFMRDHSANYKLYRVYNYDEENNAGEFFQLIDNVEDRLLMKPTQFKVLLKKVE